jgi:hypothetical protein
MADTLTPELRLWRDLEESVNWESLLLGNGASRTVWEQFSYPSLFDVATKEVTPTDRLTAEDIDLFKRLGDTRNFEAVLGALLTTQSVAAALNLQPLNRIEERYASVQKALVAAVHRVHIPWKTVPNSTLLTIRSALLEYETVFSTNYDLLVYWAIMADRPGDFRDYFWNAAFDGSDTKVWGKVTRVLYLHGALHLFYGADGRTYKERADQWANLLDLFAKRPDQVPLCITEGTAPQKMSAIARSDYLSFAFQQFGSRLGPLVMLGQGLGDTDRHLVDALSRERGRTIAVGIYPIDNAQIVSEKGRYTNLLPRANLLFFDSQSHPLGDPGLRLK